MDFSGGVLVNLEMEREGVILINNYGEGNNLIS